MAVSMDILDFLSNETYRDYFREIPGKPYVGEELFPNSEKIDDLKVSYIVGADNRPVVAKLSAYDAEPETGNRDRVDKATIELFKIQKQYRMDEKELRVFLNDSSLDAKKIAAKKLFDDGKMVYNDIRATVQLMRMQLLTDGSLNFPLFDPIGNNKAVVDYQVPSANKLALSTFSKPWSDPDADIIKDIQDMCEKTDEVPEVAMTSKRVLSYILRNKKIQAAFPFVQNPSLYLTLEQVNGLLGSLSLPILHVNEDKYRVRNSKNKAELKRFFPENKLVLYPSGPLGEMMYAITAEELVLRREGAEYDDNDNIIVYVERGANGIVNMYTKGCTIAAPTFPRANDVVQAVVIA